MRNIIVLLSALALITPQLNAQKKFIGNYHTYFGSMLEIHIDSIFKYNFHMDIESSWVNGTWRAKKDTIYFTMIPIYDTITFRDSNQTLRIDSLVLSLDQISERITSKESVSGFLTSYGQNRHSFPSKLFYRKNKLFYIRKGKLVKEKTKGFWTHKKYHTWYVRDPT